jgi:hypothetical protein
MASSPATSAAHVAAGIGHASVAVIEKHYAYLRREDIASKMLAVMERAVSDLGLTLEGSPSR